jgi:hypothetical protein
MYKSFRVRNLRCFRDLRLDELARINLIAGMNNVGKTALLEALFSHCGAYNPGLVLSINHIRGIERVELRPLRADTAPWASLFYMYDHSNTIEMEGQDTRTGQRILKLRPISEPDEYKDLEQIVPANAEGFAQLSSSSGVAQVLVLEYDEEARKGQCYLIADQKGIRIMPIPLSPPFEGLFYTPKGHNFPQEAERFGRLEVRGEPDVLLEVLGIVEPRLKRLAVVVSAGEPMLHGDIGLGRLIPLPLMGGGMCSLTSLVLAIANCQDGVVLADEIENGLHHSVLQKVWQALDKATRQFNAQLFATTHSWECVVAAHKAFLESESYDFRLHRLDRLEDDTISVRTYDREVLDAAIEMGLEVR